MTTTTEPVAPAKDPAAVPEKSGPTFEALAVLAFAFSLIAIIIAVFGTGLASRAIDEHRSTPATGASGATAVTVSLDEFKISPTPLSVDAGTSIKVTNDGAIVHDLAVEGQDHATPELAPGEGADLDLSDLEPGSYTVYCKIPGHRDSGMEGNLTVG